MMNFDATVDDHGKTLIIISETKSSYLFIGMSHLILFDNSNYNLHDPYPLHISSDRTMCFLYKKIQFFSSFWRFLLLFLFRFSFIAFHLAFIIVDCVCVVIGLKYISNFKLFGVYFSHSFGKHSRLDEKYETAVHTPPTKKNPFLLRTICTSIYKKYSRFDDSLRTMNCVCVV